MIKQSINNFLISVFSGCPTTDNLISFGCSSWDYYFARKCHGRKVRQRENLGEFVPTEFVQGKVWHVDASDYSVMIGVTVNFNLTIHT